MKIFINTFLSIIDDFTLNSDNKKEIWSFGHCWPLLAFLVFMALKQKLAFADKD